MGSVALRLNCQTAKLIFRLSHARTANRLPLRLGMLRRPRCGNPREFSFVFRFAPSREGAERRRAHPGCLPFAKDRRRLCEAGSPYGAPLRRLKCLGAPLPPDRLIAGAGRLKDIDPGPHIGPGGCPPRTPGTAVSETAGAGAAPHPHSDSLGRAPLCGWGCAQYSRSQTAVKKKFLSIGVHTARTGPVVADAFRANRGGGDLRAYTTSCPAKAGHTPRPPRQSKTPAMSRRGFLMSGDPPCLSFGETSGSRPEIALDAQDARPHVVVLDIGRSPECPPGRAAGRQPAAASAVGAAAGERRLDLGVHDLKADIEVGHRIPDRARADLPGVPVRATRAKAACGANNRIDRVAVRFVV